MRLWQACTSVIVFTGLGANALIAEPAAKTGTVGLTERIPHPVVYLDANAEADSDRATPDTDRVPHPVVYLTEPEANGSTSSGRIPHPVVYLDDDTQGSTDTSPAAVPPNPDLDTSPNEVAKPEPNKSDQSEALADAAAPIPTEPSAAAVSLTALIENKASVALDEAEWTAVAKFFQSRAFEPLWIGKTGATAAGRKIIETLDTADQWGLDPAQFNVPEVANANDSVTDLSPETWAELELQITAAALRYASHARGGRIQNPTEQLSSYLDRKPQLKEPLAILTDLAKASDPSVVLHALHPNHPQFEKLRQKYLALKAAAESPDVVRIPGGALLRIGMKHPHVALLRKRLEIPEVAPEDGSDFDLEVFDTAVLDAVKTFQKDHGLSTDGLVGNGTRRALNDIAVPDPEKILANMEQWRWMPRDMGDTHVWVNIPEFKVRLIRNGEVVHEERIIIGKLNQQTPVFSDEVETLYFHPKWHVPESIKVRELYPSLTRGGGSFRRQNLRIAYNGRPINPYNMDWSNRDIRRYHVYQPPGRGNVLGVVKFTFPNKHMVYMHDTPTKHLFKNKQRTYSHGCMRVRNPVRLAEMIVEAANGMSKADVAQILNGPVQETPVKLDKKIPVHVTYFTTWVDDEGNEQAAKDVYGHEKKIKLAVAGKFDKIAVGPDHLAPVKYTPRPQYYGTTAVEDFFKNLFPGF